MYLLNNNLSNFKLLDKLPGRSDKGKKRKGIKGLIQTAKDNPVEAIALSTGALLAARYGKAGIKTALRTSKRIGKNNAVKNSLGKAINISKIPESKIKARKATAIASAFLKGSGSKARKDIRNVKKAVNYLKTGKAK